MSKIDDLIAKHCPNGVEFKEFGEVASYIRGITYNKNDENSNIGAIKVLRSNNITLRSNTINLDDVKTVSSNVRVRDDQRLRANDILISAASGSKAHIGKVAYIKEDMDYCFGGFMAVIRVNNKISSRFLFHLLIGSSFSKYLEQALSTSTINNLSASIMNAYTIPIPPLPVQEEIVKVLDTFTKLEAELEAELEARKKQYTYYRNTLLSFNENDGNVERESCFVRWQTLGEIGMFIRGNGLQKKDFTDSGVGCIHYGQIYTYYGTYANKTKSFVSEVFAKKLRKAKSGDIIIATTSENDEDVCKALAWLGEEEIAISGDAYIYQHSLNPKYVSYFFKTEQFQKQKRTYITGTKVKRVSGDSMKKIVIPVPPLSEQARIVAILDKFDSLVNDISVGLPAEITSRHQQYEHYRNKLLTFKEAC